jgi:hypothetical protein
MHPSDNNSILIYVEDPGSANYVTEFPERFTQEGWPTVLLAGGHAQEYLDRNKCHFEAVESAATARKILQSRNPRVLLVGTSENTDSLGFGLIQEARSMGIEPIGVVDAFSNAAYRFRGKTDHALAYAPDWLIVPDSWIKEAYIKLGFSSEQIIVCGHPHYDYVLRTADLLSKQNEEKMRERLFPGLKKDQKVVIFLSEVSTGLNPIQYQCSEDYSLFGSGKYKDRTLICLEEFLDAVKTLELEHMPYLVLRLHPKDSIGNYREFLDVFNLVSLNEPPLEVIYAADVVVGMSSMLLLEAALMRRSTLSILPRREEKEWLPTIRQGVTPSVTSRAELEKEIAAKITNDSPERVNQVGDAVQFGALNCVVHFMERFFIRG